MSKKLYKANFFQKIVLPALLAILLFIISVFAFIIPAFKENVVEEKRKMIMELTNSAWSLLKKYQDDVEQGIVTLENAKNQAKQTIESLRYGDDNKDYFWITDMQPVMVIHPYVHELTGKSLEEFEDPDGVKLFMEAVKIAKTKEEGFISYRWQLKDDSLQIVPKISFVKKFAPWNWIIGTGIYLNDVETEMALLTNKIIIISISIIIIISLIIAFITHQSLRIEKSRKLAEEQLRESREKYHSLIESSTEGIILLLNNKISYTNLFIQNWLGYTNNEMSLLPLELLFADAAPNTILKINNETKKEILLKKKDNSTVEAVLTVLHISFAEKEGLLLTLRDTSENRTVKNELEELKARLHAVADYSRLGYFRFSLHDKISLTDVNNGLVSMLDYKNEEELKKVPLAKIFSSKSDVKFVLGHLKENKGFARKKVFLRKKGGSSFDVLLSLNISTDEKGNKAFFDGFIERVSMQKESLISPAEQSWDLLTSRLAVSVQKVSDFQHPLIHCPESANIMSAIEIMSRHKSDYIVLFDGINSSGIITFANIAELLFIKEFNLNIPVSAYRKPSQPEIAENTDIDTALIFAEKHDFTHLLIQNPKGDYTGVFKTIDVISLYSDVKGHILKLINSTIPVSEFKKIREKIPFLIRPMLNETGNAVIAGRLISILNDAITEKIINISLSELGASPAEFCFFTFGSSGREEFSLISDQDNALIYQDSSENQEQHKKYFTALSEKICNYLSDSGLPLCKGGYMAKNPDWCQPLSVWKNYFTDWIVNAEPQNILNISVFFDLRMVFGTSSLFMELEDFVFSALHGRSTFFYHLAQSVATFKPPLNVFGNIVSDAQGKNSDSLDIKNCLTPTIMFTRIYALQNQVRKTNTAERINELAMKEVFDKTTVEELLFHYNYLMQLRLKHQVSQSMSNTEPDNFILLKKLSDMEQVILKKVFSQINAYQAKLNASFMSSYKA
ncbi:MAG TPA: hypothetical protein DEH02_17170 [Bacteroidales bacterium]|nr:hypothetical protein [Bacteroidales bacterium]